MCTPVFIAVLFTVTKTQKQSKCPLMGEWLKHIQYIYVLYIYVLYIYIYVMEYYLAIKKKDIWQFATTQMDLEGIM